MSWSNLGQKLARIGRDTKNGVQKMSDSVSIKGRISAEKRSLERLFAVMDSPRKGLEDEYAAVKVAYANIEKYSKQLDEVNGIVYCPNCGKPADPGDKFCAKCGARLSPEERAGAKVAQDFREVGQEVGKLAGSAADKTGLKERSAKFVKDTSRKLTRRMEDVPQDPELTGSLQEEQAETGTDAEARPADAAPAQQAADTEAPAEQAAAAEAPAEQAADAGIPAQMADAGPFGQEVKQQTEAETVEASPAEQEQAADASAMNVKQADEAVEDGKDRKTES